MKYRKEFVAKFNEEATFYSCDDLNKLRMGPATAVSRYHQIFRIFVNNDMPNVGDHDFPNTSYLIVSARYMTLEPNIHKCEEVHSEVTDNHILDDTAEEVPAELEKDRKNKITGLPLDKLKRSHYEDGLQVQPSSR